MAHFTDLSPCQYHSGPFDYLNWSCPLVAVGWLEHPNAFNSGEVPTHFASKLRALAEQAGEAFPEIQFRGLHDCSLCAFKVDGTSSLSGSHINLFIPGHHQVFVAPGRIDHYIEVHSYQPPFEFIDSVLSCPMPGSSEYRRRMTSANDGSESPLFLDQARPNAN